MPASTPIRLRSAQTVVVHFSHSSLSAAFLSSMRVEPVLSLSHSPTILTLISSSVSFCSLVQYTMHAYRFSHCQLEAATALLSDYVLSPHQWSRIISFPISMDGEKRRYCQRILHSVSIFHLLFRCLLSVCVSIWPCLSISLVSLYFQRSHSHSALELIGRKELSLEQARTLIPELATLEPAIFTRLEVEGKLMICETTHCRTCCSVMY